MFCAACNHENRNGQKFCTGCGARLVLVCGACGAAHEAGDAFCGACGASLTSPVEVGVSDSNAANRTPAAYTPKHLADRILGSKSALEGERKQVTVMFADVKGSMDLAEQLDPEHWHEILDRFFAILSDGVHRFEGTVNQYTGDGIMALFGAPLAHEDHAQRACYAAMHIRDAVVDYATAIRREHGIGFSMRMGLNSGEVVVGAIGDDLRMDYTAQGHTVGLAQRMESLAEPNACYLTAQTAGLVRGYFSLDDLGGFKIKGVNEPVQVYRLASASASRTRFDVARTEGLTRFVGRAADLRTLDDALDQSDAGNGQVVGVVAEAGTGKSRLCFEFLERCRARGMKVYEGRAVAHGRNIPFLPILEVFRSYFGIALDDDAGTAREKIAGRMVVLDKAFAEALPLVFDFLGVGDPQRPAPRLDADARQRQLIAVMRQIIHSVNDAQPAITLVEDLHWMDESSAEFLEHMVDARAGTRSLLLLNFRPEYRAEWMEKSWYRQIPLTPLGRDAIAELLADRLGSDPSLDGLATPIYERTGGNPFFAEEVAQSLIESGHLEGDRGHYKLVTPIDRLEVPATVHVLLAARIDRLPEREKQLLQVASVIGKTFTEPLLTTVSNLPQEKLKDAIATLRRAEFIYEQAIYPVVEYTFKHPLTQEVALNSQLKERRRKVHGAVARAIEEHHPDDLDERAALLAHHLENAGEPAAAAKWHARAATWTSRTDWAQGNWHWRRVLSLTDEGPPSSERDSLRLDAIQQVFATGWRLRLRAEDVEPLFAEAHQLCRAMGDREQEIVLVAGWGMFRGNEGNVHHYSSLATEACALLDEGTSKEAHGIARMHACYSAYCLGRLPEALEHVDELIRRSEGDHDLGLASGGFPVWSNGCRMRGQILCEMGRFEDVYAAIATTEDVLKDEPRSEVYAWLVGDRVRLGQCTGLDSFGDVRPMSLDVLAYCERTGSDWVRTSSMRDCCGAHSLAEDWENAVEWGRAAVAFASEHGVMLQEKGDIYGRLASALRGAGKPTEACEAATEGVDWSEARSLAFQEAFCRIERAGALREAEGSTAAERIKRDLERVAVLVEETGGRSLLPRLIEERARLAALHGEDSRPGLQKALETYREIGAGGHAQRLATELGL